ncbi:MAG: hypothetical protein ABIX46_08055 [Burkholderiaceae bacterium]
MHAYDASLAVQLDALEGWETWQQTGGVPGALPPNVLVGTMGSYPRD